MKQRLIDNLIFFVAGEADFASPGRGSVPLSGWLRRLALEGLTASSGSIRYEEIENLKQGSTYVSAIKKFYFVCVLTAHLDLELREHMGSGVLCFDL